MRLALILGLTVLLFSFLMGQKSHQYARPGARDLSSEWEKNQLPGYHPDTILKPAGKPPLRSGENLSFSHLPLSTGKVERIPTHPHYPLSNSNLPDSVHEAWVSHYASGLLPGADSAVAIATDEEGNVYVTGCTRRLPVGTDFYTVKYSLDGTIIWSVRYSGGIENFARALAVDGDGNVYVTGYSENTETGKDYATVKYDAAGVQQWVTIYNGPDNGDDRATAVAVDSAGNVYVTGNSVNSTGNSDYTTVKYNASGIQQWVVRYNGPGNFDDEATALVVDANGNVYVTGTSYNSESGYDYATVRYTASGIEQWVVVYDGPENSDDRATALALDDEGNVYVTGYSIGTGTYYDYTTVKYDASGEQWWEARYDGPLHYDDRATALAVDDDSNVYVTGYSWGLNNRSDYATIKFNSEGVQQWVARYNGQGNSLDWAIALAVDGTGNVYITGGSLNSNGDSDFVTVKYDTAGVLQWDARYNGPGNDRDVATGLVVDGAGNVYVTGYSWNSDTDYDYATVKYESSGVQGWETRYDGPGNSDDWATAIVVDAVGNVYVTGGSRGSNYDSDYATVKYDANGVQRWVIRYDGPLNVDDWATALAIDGSGNVYVTGFSWGSGTGSDYATVKYDSSGVQQWVARYDGPLNGNDWAKALVVDEMGNVYVTGSSRGSGSGSDYVTVKYDSAGVQQWVARYDGPDNGDDRALALAVDGDGNVYVTGGSQGSGTGSDYATVKYDASGVQQWVARYSGLGYSDDWAKALVVDDAGNVYVTGYSGGSGTWKDYATVKYDASGVQQWVARYDGPESGDDRPAALAVDDAGNVYVTGYSVGSGTMRDYTTVKYDANGVQQWIVRYDGPENKDDMANALVVDGDGNVYVTGYSQDPEHKVYTTIKYVQTTTGVVEVPLGVPQQYRLQQNYPNPFNLMTNLRFQIRSSGWVLLKVYDLSGREVKTLVNEQLMPGDYEVQWNGTDETGRPLASGVFLYRLQVNDRFVQTRKMVFLK
jgi:uncharacterized delta-60 repeat protein